MKACRFEYHRPNSIRETLGLLADLSNARILAGGQSLVAMLNMRYVYLDHVIDINRIPELAGIEVRPSAVHMKAATRQHTILEDATLRQRLPIMAEALRFVGHLQTRNRGTVGGSLVHMDPSAELFLLAVLLDATVHISSRRGVRDVAIAEFPASYMSPRLDADEMVTAVTFQLPPKVHGWCFTEVAQRHGDFAIVAVGSILEMASDGKVRNARVAISGLGPAPIRLAEAEELMRGNAVSSERIEQAGQFARARDATGDAMAGAEYRRKLAAVLTRRALEQASARAGERVVE
jgi:aerobic carbon-monoxide dehydrogenase medium subunit